MASHVAYPVRVEADLDEGLSRWLWLVKWFLLIPHYFALAFLWLAFGFLSVLAFFSILLTARYPRAIFDFNVGVLRWSWRVAYYSYAALGTDRYPPFSLEDVPDYPVHLDVEYPERLSRGLVLVKWWLLAIPHYIIVGLLAGGAWFAFQDDWAGAGFGLIGILTLIAAVILAFTGRYPMQLFDFLLGLNRWVIRVAAYVSLMTDAYPPFRFDAGGHEGEPAMLDPSIRPAGSLEASTAPRARGRWTAGPVITLVVGCLVALMSLGALAAGGVALWADATQRVDGFVTSPSVALQTDGYAIVTGSLDLDVDGPDWNVPRAILGDARVRVMAERGPIFVGVAHTQAVRRYLDGVGYSIVADLMTRNARDLPIRPGSAPSAEPAAQDFWLTSSEGRGRQVLSWPVRRGSWSVVVMNADASKGVSVEGDIGAEAPALRGVAVGLLIGATLLAVVAVALLAGAIRRVTSRASGSS